MSDPTTPYLATGFAVAWSLIAAYLVRLWLAHRKVRSEIERLERGRTADTP